MLKWLYTYYCRCGEWEDGWEDGCMVVPDVSIVCPIQIPWWWIKSVHCGLCYRPQLRPIYVGSDKNRDAVYRLFCNPFYFYSFSSSSSKK